jgi:hypothetical protein
MRYSLLLATARRATHIGSKRLTKDTRLTTTTSLFSKAALSTGDSRTDAEKLLDLHKLHSPQAFVFEASEDKNSPEDTIVRQWVVSNFYFSVEFPIFLNAKKNEFFRSFAQAT